MSVDTVILLVTLLLSGFFSGTETAFTSSGRLALEVYHRHRRPGSSEALRFVANPNRFFTTTLVGTNLVSVIFSSIGALFLQRLKVPLEAIVIITPLMLLVFGEILPKTIARERPEVWALRSAVPLRAFYLFAYPLIVSAYGASRIVLRIFGQKKGMDNNSSITPGDLRITWRQLYRSGNVDEPQARMLDRLMAMKHRQLRDVMTPRTQVVGIPLDSPVSEAVALVHARGFSRFPVYEGDLDHIAGLLVAKDLLSDPADLKDILRPVAYFPELAPANRTLAAMREANTGLAVVVDERGGTAGIVTLEDLVETIVGQITDEHDRKVTYLHRVARNAWLVSGQTRLSVLRERLKVDLPEGDYGTVGGMIISQLGHIPEPGETFKIGDVKFRVAEATRNRVEKVLLQQPQ